MSIKNFFSEKKGKITILSLAFIIIIAITFGVSYYFMYGSSIAKYKGSVKEAISYIEKGNAEVVSTYEHMKNDDSQLYKIKNAIENSKKSLDSANKIMKDITPPDEYKELHSNLSNGINSNKTLLIQAISILNNYSSVTVNDSLSSLYEYLSVTSAYYEKFNLKGITVTVPNEFLNFPDKIGQYINSITQEIDTSSPNYDMQIAFINDIRDKIQELDNLESELNEKINSSKNGKLSSKQLMISISSTKNKLSSLVDEINALISLPEVEDIKSNSLALYKLYENYLTSFRESIESSKEPETPYIVSSSLKINQGSFNEYKSKKDNLKTLLDEKENSFN